MTMDYVVEGIADDDPFPEPNVGELEREVTVVRGLPNVVQCSRR